MCRIPEQQKKFHSEPSPEWLEVSSCSKLWKDKTTVWRNGFEDWELHTVCSSAKWQDPHRKTMRKVKTTSFYVTQTSHFHSHGVTQKGCTRMYLLAHYHRPWSCKCISSLENRNFVISVTAETREVRDAKCVSASSLLVCPGSGMMRTLCGHCCKPGMAPVGVTLTQNNKAWQCFSFAWHQGTAHSS